MKKAKLRYVTYRTEGKYVTTHYGVEWEQADGTVRKPEESKRKSSYPGAFTAAGKRYASWQELCAVKEDAYGHICRDIHGREVFAEWERFPCFDSYDYLYENRYYRWFYIREGDSLTCVYYADERKEIEITEDVCEIQERWWKEMKELDWQGERKT